MNNEKIIKLPKQVEELSVQMESIEMLKADKSELDYIKNNQIPTEIKNVNDRLNNIIANSGDSTKDSEIVDARGDFESLRDRIDSIKDNYYPFQQNIRNTTTYKPVIEAIEDIKIYGADITKKYGIGYIMRNRPYPTQNDTPKWGIGIYEVTETARIIEVCSIQEVNEPQSNKITLREVNNSCISADVFIDWSKLENNKIYIDCFYNDTGINKACYEDFFIPDSKLNLYKDYKFPFESNLSNTDVKFNRLVKAIKDIKIYTPNITNKYRIERFYHKFSNDWSLISIRDDNGRVCESYFKISEGYIFNNTVTKITLREVNNSCISADVFIDWSLLVDGDSYAPTTTTQISTGIDVRCNSQLSVSLPNIVIPTSLNAIVGKEFNIYWRNIFKIPKGKRFEDYVFRYDCPIGLSDNERFYVTPTVGQVGTKVLTLRIFENNGEVLLKQLTININVVNSSVGSSINKKCLFMGDSLTAYNSYTQHILDNFQNDVMKVALLGTQGSGINKHEGRGGWTTTQYLTQANPFLNNGKFDFSNYMNVQGYNSLDYFVIQLGTNNIKTVSNAYDLDSMMTKCVDELQIMVNSAKLFNVNLKIIVTLPIPMAQDQYAFSKLINACQLTPQIQHLGHKILCEKINERFKSDSRVYILPLNMVLDTFNNFPTEQVQVNARNIKTIEKQNDCYHPSDSGWWQMADYAYTFIKSFES